MEEVSDTGSVDTSVEDLSPSSPKTSRSRDETEGRPFSIVSHDLFDVANNTDSPEHNIPLHGSFGIGDYMRQIRSCSPTIHQQHILVAPSVSPESFYSARSHDSTHTRSSQHFDDDQQGVQSSPTEELKEKPSISDHVKHELASILSVQSSDVTEGVSSPDNERRKRRRLSLSTLQAIEYDPEPTSLISQLDPLTTSPKLQLIVSNDYVEDFLDNVSNHVCKTVLENLCPDNMRGSFCRSPDICIKQGCFFACPNYATLKYCKHGDSTTFAHSGYKHTLKGCQMNDKIDCRKKHSDGQPCRVKVLHFHVRAACITLRGGAYCQKEPCEWGHDYQEIRKKVMSNKRRTQSYEERD